MGKLRRLSGRDVCKILGRAGFLEVRQRGSHVVLQKRTTDQTVTVPIPMHRELKRGTLASIIRQSGLPRSMFEEGD